MGSPYVNLVPTLSLLVAFIYLIDAAGHPAVAWSETAVDPLVKSEIYLKHWVP